MDQLNTFDLVIFLALLAAFIIGYAQGVTRRLLGIAAIVFALILGAQLRQPFGDYLAQQWGGIDFTYSYMVAFGAVFFAAAVTLSIGIQITYRPAPLFNRFPVLDEIVGGILGVIEGFIILSAILIILDPYFTQDTVREAAGSGEFTLLRTIHNFLDPTLTAAILRDNVIPLFFAVAGGLFSQDVRDAFARVVTQLARR
jgi:uncharacterized membrane protein required for colicin V production